jgi:hypothetical protein
LGKKRLVPDRGSEEFVGALGLHGAQDHDAGGG